MRVGPYVRDEKGLLNPTYITKLVKNYRCHEAILHSPNELFYNSELIACGGEDTKSALKWIGLPNESFPVIFHAVDGIERGENGSER